MEQTQEAELRDVEESIVSYLIKNPEAIAQYSSYLAPLAFNVREYRIVYEALLALEKLERPIDAVQVETFLVERNLLEAVGGVKSLARMAAGNKLVRQPSERSIAKSIAGLAERFKRSQMLDRTTRLQAELTDMTVPFIDLTAQVEKWAIEFMASAESTAGLAPIQTTIHSTLEAVVDRTLKAREGEQPGIPTGWIDLDRLTGGWRGGKLITIAARPHQGKSLFVGNTLNTIAQTRPVAFFSLEMSTSEVEERFLSARSGVDSAKIRDGKLEDGEIEQLLSASSKLAEIEFWGNDSTSVTIDSIVSECRRFKAKHPNLGGIGIDYLQLMCQGDNPNQEISKITRKLKCLAMELDCPVFLLSQLNRGVESRNDKRPIMSDLRDSGCLTGDTMIEIPGTGEPIPIAKLVGRNGFRVVALNQQTRRLESAVVSNAFSTGLKPTFTLTTKLGRKIKATANHQFLTIDGWVALENLGDRDSIAIPASLDLRILRRLKPTIDPLQSTPWKNSDILWDRIDKIEAGEIEQVFDLTVPTHSNFLANDIIVHNSIEQDSDMILMIYRDVVYNPDTADKDIAEIIVRKFRNGNCGTVKLVFDGPHSQFKNWARF